MSIPFKLQNIELSIYHKLFLDELLPQRITLNIGHKQ